MKIHPKICVALEWLGVATIFGLCALTAFWYALVHTVHLGTLTLPDLRGIELAEAERSVHDLGLTVVVDEPGVFSPAVAPGAIAAQQPLPGFHVKTGSTVRVRLSLGSERVTVPDLRSESLQGAVRGLEQLGLHPARRVQLRFETNGDSVLAASPPIGATVPPGSEVDLLVNVTPSRELWVMPSLLSQPLERVRRYCRNNHFRLGQVHEVRYPGLPSKVVLRQYPAAGSPLSRSDIITVWVSQ
jgi:beta-lactam-binding protein with PASTA domain